MAYGTAGTPEKKKLRVSEPGVVSGKTRAAGGGAGIRQRRWGVV